ncbi:MAG: hypothetical protein JWN38_1004 [Candidatus Saccharibacteria bacterium]|nr:hypothetical protein [Candidatus Saccharibacteria bacterium]
MPYEALTIDPVFDPEHISESLMAMRTALPLQRSDLDGLLPGDYASRRKGQGLEFYGVREYTEGDDLRRINQSATARQSDEDVRMVNELRQDVAPPLWVVTDLMQDRHSVNPGHYSEQGLGLAVGFRAMSIAHARKRPSGMLAADEEAIRLTARPGLGRPHLVATAQRVVNKLGETNLDRTQFLTEAPVLERPRLSGLLTVAAKHLVRAQVLVATDWRDDDDWAEPLQRLARRNDVIAVEVTNPGDYALPTHATRIVTEAGPIALKRGRGGQKQREAYAQTALQEQARIDAGIASARVRHIKLSTTDGQWSKSFRDQLARRR